MGLGPQGPDRNSTQFAASGASVALIWSPFRPSISPTWYLGTLVPWYLGALVPWYLGSLVPWYLGTLVPWYLGTPIALFTKALT